ncbi:MAG: LPS export ABC transporter permease LptF [Gammaproteobacteria bacterium]|nr:LPS export ABC transporter permease LptF [Gammaproteobacteria bacterium]
MIINRAFYRETARTTLGIAAVLLIVMTMMDLTLLLGRAVRGSTSESVLYILLGYQMLGKIDVLLPLAFYLGILLTLSRWYRDSEMTVLAACGVGLMHFMRPVMLIGLSLGVVVMVASFYTTPLTVRQIEKIKVESSHRTEPDQVAPGVFTESSRTGRIFYAEKIRRNGDLEGVFVSSLEQGNQGVLVAQTGRPFTDAKTRDKFIALQDGTLYEGEPGAANYRILEFSVYNLRIEPKMIGEPLVPMEGLPNMALLGQLGNPKAGAELHWRAGKAIVLFVLAMYAMVFAYTDMRRGRMSNFFVAIVVYFVYSNLLGIGETMLKSGSVPAALGLWWVHAGMGSVAAYLLWRRQRNRPLFSLSLGLKRA